MSIDRSTIKVTAGLVACGMLLAGCGEVNAGRAGGETRDEPLVLTFAQPNDGEPPEQLVRWAESVERLSIGTVKIEFQNGWRYGEVDFEAGTLSDVADGKVDLAWAGARAFDTVGVASFQALVAPMLVDSHDLQAAVFEAGIPEQMLEGVDELGLVGVGVLPGPMRKLLGTDHPYVVPADFADNVIGLQASGVAEQTFTALGATTTRLPSGRGHQRGRRLRAAAGLDLGQPLRARGRLHHRQPQPLAPSPRPRRRHGRLRVARRGSAGGAPRCERQRDSRRPRSISRRGQRPGARASAARA